MPSCVAKIASAVNDVRRRTSQRFGLRAALLALTILLLLGLGFSVYHLYYRLHQAQIVQLQLLELSEKIIHLDEALTGSVRLAAASGQSSWHRRYLHLRAELDSAIDRAVYLAPQAFTSELAQSFAIDHDKLTALESHAFDLLSRADQTAAADIIFSSEYEKHRINCQQALTHIVTAMHSQAIVSLRNQRLMIGAVGFCFPTMLFVWMVLARGLIRHFAVREEAEQLRYKARTRLAKRASQRPVHFSRYPYIAKIRP